MTPHLPATLPAYAPHDLSQTLLYRVVADHLETFLSPRSTPILTPEVCLPMWNVHSITTTCSAVSWPMAFCGWAVTPATGELLLAFSCKRRGFCPSCAGRRIAQTAAHLVEQVIPWVPTRQWVVSAPVPLRYWMAASQELTAVSCATSATWRWASTRLRPPAMTPCVMTRRSWPVPWPPRCSSACLWRVGWRAGAAHWRRLWRGRRGAHAHRSPLCQRAGLFLARQYPGPGPSARSVGAPDSVYHAGPCPWSA